MVTYVFVGVIFPLVCLIKNLHKVLVSIRGIVNHSSLMLVVDKSKNFKITENCKFHGFFQKSLLSLAIGYLYNI